MKQFCQPPKNHSLLLSQKYSTKSYLAQTHLTHHELPSLTPTHVMEDETEGAFYINTVMSLKQPLLAQDSTSSQHVYKKFNNVVYGVSKSPKGTPYYNRSRSDFKSVADFAPPLVSGDTYISDRD